MRRLLKIGFVLAVIAVVASIYWDAYACWRSGGTPVSSIGHFHCAA